MQKDMRSRPLVSIVTPVYNEALYLGKCIESVLSQTYTNWDYTIVDNCSTDGSVEIARSYAASDRRIRVVENQRFLQAIPNHNAGLRQISPNSKYCKVVLGDDWIFPECLERLVEVGEAYPNVALIGAYALCDRDVNWTGLPYEIKVIDGREACRRHFLEGLYIFGTATSVLYRADLVRSHNPFYNEANIHADTEVCFTLLRNHDFGFVHQVLTFTRVRTGSITAACDNIGSNLPSMLHLLVTHGPNYLSREELDLCLKRHLQGYYHILGKSLIGGRERVFWEYHKTALEGAGVGFSRMRLMQGMFATVFDAVLNPKASVEKLFNRGKVQKADHSWEKRYSRSSQGDQSACRRDSVQRRAKN